MELGGNVEEASFSGDLLEVFEGLCFRLNTRYLGAGDSGDGGLRGRGSGRKSS